MRGEGRRSAQWKKDSAVWGSFGSTKYTLIGAFRAIGDVSGALICHKDESLPNCSANWAPVIGQVISFIQQRDVTGQLSHLNL